MPAAPPLALRLPQQALRGVKELARDVQYTRNMETGWKAPLRYRLMSEVGARGAHGGRRRDGGADVGDRVGWFAVVDVCVPASQH